MSSPAVSVPLHQLHESPNSRSIDVNGWFITTTTNPISNASECDLLQASLGIPLPEMTFGNNNLTLEHRPSGWKYSFSTKDALSAVKKGELGDGDGGVKVDYADAWLKSRSSNYNVMPKTVATKPYDWTYTTTYPGHTETDSTIPIAELTRPDPILFYAEIPLFEDELHDNGSSGLLIRIRVMPTCIFILSRFTLRVDNVLFRVFDTRIYHSFESEPSMAPYNAIKDRLPKRDDLTPLTDPNFIAKALADTSQYSQTQGARTGWRSLGKQLEYSTLTA
ncbi:type 2A phosphatase activator TIP41 [Mucidula mucida]|nr:type 2A phosphatase activator TIP41 [Mucidula mucida]